MHFSQRPDYEVYKTFSAEHDLFHSELTQMVF